MDLAEQIAYYQRKYELNPRARVFAPLADLYRKDGQLQEAMRLLEKGLERHPRYVSALVIRARCQLDAGHREEARETFHQILKIDPNNLVVLKLLAEDAARQEDWSEATGLLERVVLLDPTDAPAEAKLTQLRTRDQPQPQSSAAADQTGGGLARGDLVAESVGEAAATERNEVGDTGERGVAEKPANGAVAPDETVERTADQEEFETAADTTPPAHAASADQDGPSLATKTLAEIYLAQGYRDKALAVLRQILTRHPDRDDVRAKIAEVEREIGVQGAETADPPRPPAAAEPPPRPGRGEGRQHFESWIEKLSRKGEDEK